MTNPKQVCLVFFLHPSKYTVIPIPKKLRSVTYSLIIQLMRADHCRHIVLPLSNGIPLAVETDAIYQIPLLFGFPKMGKDMSCIAVELLLYYSAMGQWPLTLISYSLANESQIHIYFLFRFSNQSLASLTEILIMMISDTLATISRNIPF